LRAICAIEDASFTAPYPLALLDRLLKEYSGSFFVAEDEKGELVGYSVCSTNSESAHLISIAVRSSFRRNGVATALMQRTVEFLISQSVGELRLEVNLKNTGALSLYSKLGFEAGTVIKGYYSDGSDAVRMRISLKGTDPEFARRIN
jgi:ribosomal-protein-alanine N-acetyltransferase